MKIDKEVEVRTKEQQIIVNESIIFLTIQDVCNLTGWCEATTRQVFQNDTSFPAILQGKAYLVEYHAFIEWCKHRHVRNDEK